MPCSVKTFLSPTTPYTRGIQTFGPRPFPNLPWKTTVYNFKRTESKKNPRCSLGLATMKCALVLGIWKLKFFTQDTMMWLSALQLTCKDTQNSKTVLPSVSYRGQVKTDLHSIFTEHPPSGPHIRYKAGIYLEDWWYTCLAMWVYFPPSWWVNAVIPKPGCGIHVFVHLCMSS